MKKNAKKLTKNFEKRVSIKNWQPLKVWKYKTIAKFAEEIQREMEREAEQFRRSAQIDTRKYDEVLNAMKKESKDDNS